MGSSQPRVIEPRDKSVLAIFDFCTRCAATFAEFPSSIGEEVVTVTTSIDGREYTESKTIKELAVEAERRGYYERACPVIRLIRNNAVSDRAESF